MRALGLVSHAGGGSELLLGKALRKKLHESKDDDIRKELLGNIRKELLGISQERSLSDFLEFSWGSAFLGEQFKL